MKDKPAKERLTALPVRVATWQYDALCKRAFKRGVGLGEALRAILDEALAPDRS